MSLNFLTKSMWEGKKWIIPGYLISWNTIIPVNSVCVCVGIVSPMYYFLWSTYILPISYIRMLPRFSAREIGWENVLQQCMCNIIYACVTSHVQNHVHSESVWTIHVLDMRLWKYLFYVSDFTLTVYVR